MYIFLSNRGIVTFLTYLDLEFDLFLWTKEVSITFTKVRSRPAEVCITCGIQSEFQPSIIGSLPPQKPSISVLVQRNWSEQVCPKALATFTGYPALGCLQTQSGISSSVARLLILLCMNVHTPQPTNTTFLFIYLRFVFLRNGKQRHCYPTQLSNL